MPQPKTDVVKCHTKRVSVALDQDAFETIENVVASGQ